MASIKKKGKYYYVYFNVGSKRTSISTKSKSNDVAQKIRKKIENEIATGRFRINDYLLAKKSLQEFLAEALTYSQANKSASTAKREKRIFDNFLKYFDDIDLSKITAKKIEEYKAYLLDQRKFMPSSINIELRHLSAAFSLAVKYEYLQNNPFRKVAKLKVPKKLPIYLSHAQANDLLKAAQAHGIYDHVLSALYTGGRISEICNLDWSAIDLQQKTLRLFGKGAKERTVAIPDTLLRHLQSKKVKNESVLTGVSSADATSRRFRKAADSIGLTNFTFHNLRDTYASWLAQQGVSLKIIQELLGHEAIQTTLIYAHLSPAAKANAVKVLDSIATDDAEAASDSDAAKEPDMGTFYALKLSA